MTQVIAHVSVLMDVHKSRGNTGGFKHSNVVNALHGGFRSLAKVAASAFPEDAYYRGALAIC